MNSVQNDQGQPDMQLVEIILEVLDAGVLPMSVERRIYELLKSRDFNETEILVIERLIEALNSGKVQPIA